MNKQVPEENLPTSHMFGYMREDEDQVRLPSWMTKQNGITVVEINKPIIAKTNYMTRVLGIPTTEDYRKAFAHLKQEGDPVTMKIDTPGGDPSQLFELAEEIHDMGDQVEAYVSGMCFSAGIPLFLAVKNRVAHETAMLGSIGVISYMNIWKDMAEDVIVVRSEGAKNKNTESSMRDATEVLAKSFYSYLERFTGLSESDFRQAGREGSTISAADALAAGWVTDLGRFSEALDSHTANTSETDLSLSSTSMTGNIEMKKYTQEQLEDAVKTAAQDSYADGLKKGEETASSSSQDAESAAAAAAEEVHTRYAQLSEANSGGQSFKTIQRLARMSCSTEEAVAFLGDLQPVTTAAGGAPAGGAPAKATTISMEDAEEMAAQAANAAVDSFRASMNQGNTGFSDVGGGDPSAANPQSSATHQNANWGDPNQAHMAADDSLLQAAIDAANQRQG